MTVFYFILVKLIIMEDDYTEKITKKVKTEETEMNISNDEKFK